MKKQNVIGIKRIENKLYCNLVCGHLVVRKIKKRCQGQISSGQFVSTEDPDPTWVYCGECE